MIPVTECRWLECSWPNGSSSWSWPDGSSPGPFLEVQTAEDVSILSAHVQQQIQFETGESLSFAPHPHPHNCIIFPLTYDFLQHILNMHTVGKELQCEICDKKVKNKWYLRRHHVTHHGAPLKKWSKQQPCSKNSSDWIQNHFPLFSSFNLINAILT